MKRAARKRASAIYRDAQSYEAVMAALKLPKESAEDRRMRDAAIESATRHATEAPMETDLIAVEVFEKLAQLEAVAAPSMLSDLNVGRLLAAAPACGALENVVINLH